MTFLDELEDKPGITQALQPHDDVIIACAERNFTEVATFSVSSWRVLSHIPKESGDVWLFVRNAEAADD